MANSTGKIGQLREEELPVVRVIVPPDPNGRVFEDDLDPGDLVFDGKLTPMLVWHERYPVGRGWRSGWVLSYDTDGNGNSDDYIVGLALKNAARYGAPATVLRNWGFGHLVDSAMAMDAAPEPALVSAVSMAKICAPRESPMKRTPSGPKARGPADLRSALPVVIPSMS